MVRDIVPGLIDSFPTELTNVNGTLFFVASDATHGRELWRSDGTDAGTVLVADIVPGANGSLPSQLTNVNGTLFFTISSAANGFDLWRSDGTAAGTVAVEGMGRDAAPAELTNVDGRLFFRAFAPATGTELWALGSLGSLGLCPITAEPAMNCKAPVQSRRATLVLRDRSPDSADQVTWKWTNGMATTKADFGDPVAITDYALCIYDTTSGSSRLTFAAKIPSGGTCGSRSCWKETDSGFQYTNVSGTPDGLRTLVLKQGFLDGSARIVVQGRGTNLSLPALPLTQDPTVTVQLRSSTGACWTADFSSSVVNDAIRFKAKAD
jgi:ELWxxDGT repeat protein